MKHGAKCALLMSLAGCASLTRAPSPPATPRHEAIPLPESSAPQDVPLPRDLDPQPKLGLEYTGLRHDVDPLHDALPRQDVDPQDPNPPPKDSARPEGTSRHKEGNTFIQTRAFYGIPILRKSFYWDGNGEVYDSGLGVHVGTFVSDQFAVGLGSNLTTWWTPGRDVYSVELEMLLRWFPVADWPVFVNGTGGYQLANHEIPPGGTMWNFTFSWGLGVEFPIAKSMNLITAADYHHISNALGRESLHNPSQNEVRLWVGVEWIF